MPCRDELTTADCNPADCFKDFRQPDSKMDDMANRPDVLLTGESLSFRHNDCLISHDGRIKLSTRDDGEMLLYGSSNADTFRTKAKRTNSDEGRTRWQSETKDSKAVRLTMQDDCNIVMFNADNKQIWESQTKGRGAKCFLKVEDNGNLALYDEKRELQWERGECSRFNDKRTGTMDRNQYERMTNVCRNGGCAVEYLDLTSARKCVEKNRCPDMYGWQCIQPDYATQGWKI
jgi:hypothetical protein